MRLAALRVPIVIATVLPRGGRVDVLPVLISLFLPLSLPLGLPYRLSVCIIVPIVVAQGIPISVIPKHVPIDVVVVRSRDGALTLSAYETAT